MQSAVQAYQAGDLSGARLILEQILVKEPRNAAARNYLQTITEKEAKSAATKRRLDAVVIPKIDFRDVSAREAFEFTLQAIERGSGAKPNLVWIVPAENPPRVTLALDNVPGATALTYIADLAGLKIAFEEHAVRVSAPAP